MNIQNSTILVLVLLFSQPTIGVSATDVAPQDLGFNIYLDKSTIVTYTVTVQPTLAKVTIPIIGSQLSDILVLDSDGKLLSYNITQDGLSITNLGSSRVVISYETTSLVTGIGKILTFNASTTITSKVILPKYSTLLTTNIAPLEITTKNQQTTLVLPAGNLSLTLTQLPTSSDQPLNSFISDYALILIGGVITILLASVTFFLLKKRKND